MRVHLCTAATGVVTLSRAFINNRQITILYYVVVGGSGVAVGTVPRFGSIYKFYYSSDLCVPAAIHETMYVHIGTEV